MTTTAVDRQQLLDAVNLLITHADAQQLYDSMLAVANLYRVQPIQLTGDAAPLNVLLDLKLKDEDAYDRIIALVDNKRSAAGLQQLNRPVSDRFNKTSYMRDFMDRKRQRTRRAVEIENMLRPPKDKLVGVARLNFMDHQAARWKQELDTKLEKAREAHGARLPKEILDSVRNTFWQKIDGELDELEELARKETLKAGTGPASLEALHRALQDDPYKK